MYMFFSSVHGTNSRTDHVLGHRMNLNTLEETETISSIFSNHNGMKLEINYKKKTKKHKNMEAKQHATEQ